MTGESRQRAIPPPPNIPATAQALDGEWWRKHVMLATVVDTAGDLVQVQPNGPGVDAKFYTRFAGKWPLAPGDVVGMIDFSGIGGWVIVGKIGGDTT